MKIFLKKLKTNLKILFTYNKFFFTKFYRRFYLNRSSFIIKSLILILFFRRLIFSRMSKRSILNIVCIHLLKSFYTILLGKFKNFLVAYIECGKILKTIDWYLRHSISKPVLHISKNYKKKTHR